MTLEGLVGMEGGLEYTDKRTMLYWGLWGEWLYCRENWITMKGGQGYTGDFGGVAVIEGGLEFTDGRTRLYWGLWG